MSEYPRPLQERLVAWEDLRQELATCLDTETQAEQELYAAEQEIWQERDKAAAESEDDDAVEKFAAWLPTGRRRVAAAQIALDRANAETVRLRAALCYVAQVLDNASRLS